jgi:hypothetical protein
MKLCSQIVLAVIAVFLLSAGVALAQIGDDGSLAFTVSNYQLDQSGENNGQNVIIRNRLDYGATWTASADVLVLERSGGASFPMLQRFSDNAELLNSQDFVFQMGVGPRVSIVGEDIFYGFDIEASYFAVENWSADKTVVSPAEGMQYMLFGSPLYYMTPGTTATYNYVSRLHNAELNFRRPIWENVSLLAGFRYLQLHEDLNSILADGGATYFNAGFNVDNHLYGGQIGLNVAFINRPRFSIEGVMKAGVFGNFSDLTLYSDYLTESGDKTTHTSFLGEIGLTGIVQVTSWMSVRGGYQVMWLDGIGIAGDQFRYADSETNKPYMAGTLLYHGAFAGVECCY